MRRPPGARQLSAPGQIPMPCNTRHILSRHDGRAGVDNTRIMQIPPVWLSGLLRVISYLSKSELQPLGGELIRMRTGLRRPKP